MPGTVLIQDWSAPLMKLSNDWIFAAVLQSKAYGEICCKVPHCPTIIFCCKKIEDDRGFAWPSINDLPRSPASYLQAMRPPIFTRTRLSANEILITSAKDFCNKNGTRKSRANLLSESAVGVKRPWADAEIPLRRQTTTRGGGGASRPNGYREVGTDHRSS